MFKSMSKWALYGILVVVMLSLPVTVFALSGGDPEPGAGCDDGITYEYNSTIYTGTIALTWEDTKVYYNGVVTQIGQTEFEGEKYECTATFNGQLYGPMTSAEFNSLTQEDITGVCLTDIADIFGADEGFGYECFAEGKYEVSKARGLRTTGPRTLDLRIDIINLVPVP